MGQTLGTYGDSLANATRPIYWNLPSLFNQVVMYLFFIVALTVLVNAILQRIFLWSSGKESRSPRPWTVRRIWESILSVVFQKKTSRDPKAGLFHAFIYFGFITLTVTTTAVMLQHDFNLDVYIGSPYLVLTVGSDLFGFLFLVGICLATQRRYVDRPDKLHISKGDSFMLSLLAWLIIQGFLLEGLRIHGSNDPWSHYSFIGLLVSKFFWSLSMPATSILHFSIWWIHAITAFAFFAVVPYSKFFHIISSSLNLIYAKMEPLHKGKAPSPGDIGLIMEQAMESEDPESLSLGINTLADLDWKTRLSLDACTSCGRCQDVCPAYNSGKALSPKWLILDTRDHMLAVHASRKPTTSDKNQSLLSKICNTPLLRTIDSFLLKSFLLSGSPSLHSDTKKRAQNPLVQNSVKDGIGNPDASIAGGVMEEDVFWSCTTCGACVEVCPVSIDHVDFILETRQNLMLMQGKLPSEAQGVLRAIEAKGTPLGEESERSDWTAGLEINFIKEGDSVDILYWVGCISAFDTRKQSIAKSMVKILNYSGLSWGMLGNLESCTGDPARRLGDENTFQVQAKKNITTFSSVNFDRIVTHCPHCLNTIKNEYPEIGNISTQTPEILHHSVFIQELLKLGTISVSNDLDTKVTFHDPCYLGRYNGTFDEPRDILVQLGGRSTEMKSSREKSMCCGAGGGHYWQDMKVGERVNVQRVDEAIESGAEIIASACPFCMQMLEDGIKLNEKEDQLEVQDIAELVASKLIEGAA